MVKFQFCQIKTFSSRWIRVISRMRNSLRVLLFSQIKTLDCWWAIGNTKCQLYEQKRSNLALFSVYDSSTVKYFYFANNKTRREFLILQVALLHLELNISIWPFGIFYFIYWDTSDFLRAHLKLQFLCSLKSKRLCLQIVTCLIRVTRHFCASVYMRPRLYNNIYTI